MDWLGREDSNLRMAESKSAALPLGYAPFENPGFDDVLTSCKDRGEAGKRSERSEIAPPAAPHTSGAQTRGFAPQSPDPYRLCSKPLIRPKSLSFCRSTLHDRQLQSGMCNGRRDQRAPPFVPFRLLVLGVLMPQPEVRALQDSGAHDASRNLVVEPASVEVRGTASGLAPVRYREPVRAAGPTILADVPGYVAPETRERAPHAEAA
jgi:hypothetical protein